MQAHNQANESRHSLLDSSNAQEQDVPTYTQDNLNLSIHEERLTISPTNGSNSLIQNRNVSFNQHVNETHRSQEFYLAENDLYHINNDVSLNHESSVVSPSLQRSRVVENRGHYTLGSSSPNRHEASFQQFNRHRSRNFINHNLTPLAGASSTPLAGASLDHIRGFENNSSRYPTGSSNQLGHEISAEQFRSAPGPSYQQEVREFLNNGHRFRHLNNHQFAASPFNYVSSFAVQNYSRAVLINEPGPSNRYQQDYVSGNSIYSDADNEMGK